MKKLHDKQEIAPLLDKFMTGVSTADEEQVLEQYFLTHEVSKEWRVYKEMFACSTMERWISRWCRVATSTLCKKSKTII